MPILITTLGEETQGKRGAGEDPGNSLSEQGFV